MRSSIWVGNMPHGHEGEDPHALLTALPDTPALARHEHGHHTGDMGKVLAAVKRSGRLHQFRTRLDL